MTRLLRVIVAAGAALLAMAASAPAQMQGPLQGQYPNKPITLIVPFGPGSTTDTISRIIAQDPALTGNLLRIANSAMYRLSGQPVESIDRAVQGFSSLEGVTVELAERLVEEGFLSYDDLSVIEPDAGTAEQTLSKLATLTVTAEPESNTPPATPTRVALLQGPCVKVW